MKYIDVLFIHFMYIIRHCQINGMKILIKCTTIFQYFNIIIIYINSTQPNVELFDLVFIFVVHMLLIICLLHMSLQTFLIQTLLVILE